MTEDRYMTTTARKAPNMTTTTAIRNLTTALAIAANERDGFTYDRSVLDRAATAPAGIVGR